MLMEDLLKYLLMTMYPAYSTLILHFLCKSTLMKSTLIYLKKLMLKLIIITLKELPKTLNLLLKKCLELLLKATSYANKMKIKFKKLLAEPLNKKESVF